MSQSNITLDECRSVTKSFMNVTMENHISLISQCDKKIHECDNVP
jgi:hypothetical protein